LRFDASAKVSALSGAYTGMAKDEQALFYNPAGLTQLYNGVFGLNHAEWLEDIRIDNIVYAQPILGRFSLAASLTHMWMPTLEGKDQYGNSTGSFEVSSSIAQIGLAFDLHRNLSVGAALKYFQDNLAGYRATGLAYDAGIHLRAIPNRLSLGLVVQNLGSPIRYDQKKQNIPMTYRGGIAIELVPGSFVLSTDISKSIDTEFRYHLGATYTYQDMATLRVGNRFSAEQVILPSFGVGFLVQQQFQIDYTFSNIQELGITHRVGLSFRFPSGTKYRAFSQRTKAIYPPSQVRASIAKQTLQIEWKKMKAVQYNVYARTGTSGPWTKLNPDVLKKNSYRSKIPLDAGLYYFKVTAVREGTESVPSEIAVLQVKQSKTLE